MTITMKEEEKMQQPFAETPLGAPTPGAQGAPTPGAPRAINLAGLLSRTEATTGLTEAGRKYVDQLEAQVKINAEKHGLNITITQLTTPTGVIFYECNGAIFPIFMHEAINLSNEIPDTAILRDALAAYQTRRGVSNFKTVSSTVIHPSDYGRVESMANLITNTFISLDPAMALSAESLASMNLQIDTGMPTVAALLDRWSPKSTPARAEFGFALNILPNNKRNSYGRPQTGFFEQFQSDTIPAAVATGYVELVDAQQPSPIDGAPRYTPIVHISDIVSPLQSLQLTQVMICMFADLVFYHPNFWQSQFTQFAKDQPNLGRLIVDISQPGAEPEFVDSMPKLSSFIQKFLTAPVLVIDVVDGMPRSPGIELFAMPDQAPLLVAEFEKLIGHSLVVQNMPTRVLYTEYTGVVPGGKDGSFVDSRNLDYLTLMVNFSNDPQRVAPFLQRHPGLDPKLRIQALQQFYPALQVMYNNSVCGIDPGLLAQVQNVLRQNVTVVSTQQGQPASISLASYIQDWQTQYNQNRQGFGVSAAAPGQFTSFQSGAYPW